MILPINTNPSIISDVKHAFPLAIMEQGMKHSLASLRLNVASEQFTEEIENDVKLAKRDCYMEIWSKKYASNTECFSLRECACEEDLVLEILSLRRDVRGGILCLMLAGEDYQQASQSNQGIYRIGIGGEELFYSENENVYHLCVNGNENKWRKKLRLVRSKNLITYYVMEEEEWIKIHSAEVPVHMQKQKLYIGIYGNWGEIQYYNWKYMNYLQLVYDEKEERIWLDYFLYPQKGEFRHHSQQFIDCSIIPQDEFCEIFKTISAGVLWYIRHGYYVELMLDEYYINERAVTGEQHFFHNNLLYGYSKDETEFYALGYKEKIRVSAIAREDIDRYIKPGAGVRIYRYEPNPKNMTFRIQRFIQLLKQFVEGQNSGAEFGNILASEEYIYGIKILDRIQKNPKAQYALQHDSQMSFLFYEHSCLMLERLDFLLQRKYISVEEHRKLHSMCSVITVHAEVLKNLVLKNRLKENYNKAIKERFVGLCEEEQSFYRYLLKILCDRYQQ